jgi:hypothetical protein
MSRRQPRQVGVTYNLHVYSTLVSLSPQSRVTAISYLRHAVLVLSRSFLTVHCQRGYIQTLQVVPGAR